MIMTPWALSNWCLIMTPLRQCERRRHSATEVAITFHLLFVKRISFSRRNSSTRHAGELHFLNSRPRHRTAQQAYMNLTKRSPTQTSLSQRAAEMSHKGLRGRTALLQKTHQSRFLHPSVTLTGDD